jgi:hypothetical protein
MPVTVTKPLRESRKYDDSNDCWYIDERGRSQYYCTDDGPPPAAVREIWDRRDELQSIDEQLDDLRAPSLVAPGSIVSIVSIDGRSPASTDVDLVRAELAKAPAAIVAELRAAGGRIDVIPGENAARHPESRLTAPCWGWSSALRALIVIAAESGAITTLHELGHWHDRFRRFSRLPEWQKIVRDEQAVASDIPGLAVLQNIPGYVFDRPEEHFAECFALYFSGPYCRAKLTASMRRFIESTMQPAKA